MYKHYETSDDVFVDREEYIEWMNDALVRCKKKSVVLHLKGIGGIGKSSLLKHWIKTKERTIRVDCEHYSEFYDRLNVLAKGAALHGVNLQRFDVLWQIRQRFVEGVEPVKEEGREWAKDVVMAIPFIGSLASIGSALSAVGTKVTPKLRGKYSTVGKWLQDRLGKNHIERLLEILWKEPRHAEFLYIDALLEDINNRKDIVTPMLFLLDHFEYVDGEDALWKYQEKKITQTELWSIFLSSLMNCVGVMAGRKPAVKREELTLEETELTELDRESCIEMLDLRGVTDKDLQDRIVSVSGGNPFVVDAICDMSETSNISVDDIESLRAETLEDVRLKTWKRLFSQAQDLLGLVDKAGLLPFFNREIMNIVAPEMKTVQWNALLNLSFVIERDDGNFVLHDLAEELVRTELGNRLQVITEEAAGLLEKASEENDDYMLLGLSLSVVAVAAPEKALEKLKRFYIRADISWTKLIVLFDAIKINTDVAKLFILDLKGWSLMWLGRYADAEQAIRAALEDARELAKNNADQYLDYLAVAQQNLASLLDMTNRPIEADGEYREGLETFRKFKEKEKSKGRLMDPWNFFMYISRLRFFGTHLVALGHYEEAMERFNEILSLKDDYQKVMIDFEPVVVWNHIAVTYTEISRIYGRMDRIAEAEETLRSALDGPLHPSSESSILVNLHNRLEKSGKTIEAEKALREGLRLSRNVYEQEPNSTGAWISLAFYLVILAAFLRKIGIYSEAEEVLKESLKIAKQHAPSEGLDSDVVVWPLDEFAILLRHLGRYEEAEEAHTEELETLRKSSDKYPNEFRSVLIKALNNLAILLSHIDRLAESEEKYQEAIVLIEQESRDSLRGYSKASVRARILNNYSIVLKHTDRFSESEKTLTEALEIKRKLTQEFPENLLFLSELAITLSNLGVLMIETERHSEAENLFRESLRIRRQLVDKSTDYFLPGLPRVLNNLGILLWRMNQPAEAEKVYQEALSISENLMSKEPRVYQKGLVQTLTNFHVLSTETSKTEEIEKLSNRLKELGVEEIPQSDQWCDEEEEI
ncbi:MAG: tetratricopeptide repeat protein [Candidatus Thorarchaeota archaeon]|nr:tetratricopeptide repeat protein [Candidatus Thorarchaeota archaeon]